MSRVLAIDLRLALAHPLNALGEYGQWLTVVGEAETVARGLDACARLGRVLVQRAAVLRLKGDLNGAMAVGQRALALAAMLGNSTVQMEAFLRLGQVYWAIGDFGQAAELLRQNVEVADWAASTSSTDLRIESQAWLVRTLSETGAFAEGR